VFDVDAILDVGRLHVGCPGFTASSSELGVACGSISERGFLALQRSQRSVLDRVLQLTSAAEEAYSIASVSSEVRHLQFPELIQMGGCLR